MKRLQLNIGRQVDKQVGRQVGRQVGWWVGRQVGRKVGGWAGRQVGRQVGRWVGGLMGTQVGGQVGWWVSRLMGRQVGGQVDKWVRIEAFSLKRGYTYILHNCDFHEKGTGILHTGHLGIWLLQEDFFKRMNCSINTINGVSRQIARKLSSQTREQSESTWTILQRGIYLVV